MSILADHQIRQLCTVPSFVITTNVPQPVINGNYVYPKEVESFTYASENVLKEEIKQVYSSINGLFDKKHLIGITDYRLLTQEEKDNFKPMISPFVDGQVRVDEQGNKVISYGLSSSGYDLRIAPEFKIFTNTYSTIVDPKNFDSNSFVDFTGSEVIIPPNSFVLARSLERFVMPRDVCAIVVGKSTLARVGINCLCTPLENSWEGYLTLEFANVTPLPVKLYANEGGCQCMFFKNSSAPDVSYSDRNGKYSNQGAEIVLAKV